MCLYLSSFAQFSTGVTSLSWHGFIGCCSSISEEGHHQGLQLIDDAQEELLSTAKDKNKFSGSCPQDRGCIVSRQAHKCRIGHITTESSCQTLQKGMAGITFSSLKMLKNLNWFCICVLRTCVGWTGRRGFGAPITRRSMESLNELKAASMFCVKIMALRASSTKPGHVRPTFTGKRIHLPIGPQKFWCCESYIMIYHVIFSGQSLGMLRSTHGACQICHLRHHQLPIAPGESDIRTAFCLSWNQTSVAENSVVSFHQSQTHRFVQIFKDIQGISGTWRDQSLSSSVLDSSDRLHLKTTPLLWFLQDFLDWLCSQPRLLIRCSRSGRMLAPLRSSASWPLLSHLRCGMRPSASCMFAYFHLFWNRNLRMWMHFTVDLCGHCSHVACLIHVNLIMLLSPILLQIILPRCRTAMIWWSHVASVLRPKHEWCKGLSFSAAPFFALLLELPWWAPGEANGKKRSLCLPPPRTPIKEFKARIAS